MPINYEPYTTSHVIAQLQLLCFSALAFAGLQMFKLYPPELRSTNLDADWFYRKGLALVNRFLDLILNGINVAAKSLILGRTVPFFIGFLNNLPSHFMAWLQTPQWGLWSGRNLQVRDNRKSLREAAFTGVFPVGFGALAAVIIFGVLFFAR